MSVRGDCQSSDSQSDATGRGSSLSSRDDVVEIAAQLGILRPELIVIDRFVVDRKRMEVLLFGEGNSPATAEEFFDNIMYETGTKVVWPSRLKLGARSKKDPHVKVMGLEETVDIAKRRILSVLEMKNDRVTMKIDVSYTDHSHIIGKGGMSIKRVMEDTQCHIHFPDSNRNNQVEKSNQVSISGTMQGVERARARVRELMPLIFCFDLPIMGSMMGNLDPTSPVIKEIQETYNIQVMVRSRQKLNSTLVVVKGCEWEVEKVKEATQLLIHHTCEHLASQMQVHMMLEISPQHQSIVLGENHKNLKGIMQRTNTQIIFVDPSDPNIPKIKKSNVTITGSINNVYLARQQLIGSLPVVIMFDVADTAVVIDCEKIESIMNNLDVYINTRNKVKQNYVSFIIKGIERNIHNIYEARRHLLNIHAEEINVEIPFTYQIPLSESCKTNYSNTPICVSSPLVAPNGNMVGRTGNVFEFPWPPMNQHLNNHQMTSTYPPPPPTSPAAPFFRPPPHQNQPPHVQLPPHLYHLGHFSHSSQSLPDHLQNSICSNTSNYSSPSTSPRTVSPLPHVVSEKTNIRMIGSDGKLSERDWKPPGLGLERNEIKKSDYQRIKFQALHAMQKPIVPDEIRIPTSNWSGLGFSQSSPHSGLTKELNKSQQVANGNDMNWRDIWGGEESVFPLTNSNYLEALPPLPGQYRNAKDLRTLLTYIGCEKYMPLFVSNEIDLSTFRLLTESDLRDIGITTFGARRKMAFCIAELNRQQTTPFNGSAAPGAEREASHNNW